MINKENLPKFVSLAGTALRLRENKKDYYRDGGNWSVGYKIIDGKLHSWKPYFLIKLLHRTELIEITEEEWRKDNGQYAPF